MTIVNPGTINKWEVELIESLVAALQVHEVRRLFTENFGLGLRENLEFDHGRIATFNNQIAYDFRFKAIAVFPVVIDRSGNFLGFGRMNEEDIMLEDQPGPDKMLSDPDVIRRKERELLTAVASDLNLDGLGALLGKEFKPQILGEPRFKSGDLVVFNGQAGFQLNIEMAINFSILVSRNGNFLDFGDFNQPQVSAEKNRRFRAPEFGIRYRYRTEYCP